MSEYKITPMNSIEHSAFQKKIESMFVNSGFAVLDTTYHNSMTQNQVKMLQKNTSYTAQYKRTSPDFIVLKDNSCYQVEIKSNNNTKYRNASIEAYPLAISATLSKLNINTLYFFFDSISRREVVFDAANLPKIYKICIPSWRWSTTEQIDFIDLFRSVFPDVKIEVKDTTKTGSGDVFAIILVKELEKLQTVDDFFGGL